MAFALDLCNLFTSFQLEENQNYNGRGCVESLGAISIYFLCPTWCLTQPDASRWPQMKFCSLKYIFSISCVKCIEKHYLYMLIYLLSIVKGLCVETIYGLGVKRIPIYTMTATDSCVKPIPIGLSHCVRRIYDQRTTTPN